MCQVCGCTPDLEGLSKVERVKARSQHLRGTIKQELAEETAAFSEESAQLLKFHGVYQQDDRDRRKEARQQGLDKFHSLMIRTRIPGGAVSADAYLAHDGIAGSLGNGSLRVTTRQDFQLHGVLKGNLKAAIRRINDGLLTTLGGCGDQERNIMCCPAPLKDRFRSQVLSAIAGLVPALTPSTNAYHEIWLDGAVVSSSQESEPLYGEQYLPRKFKTTVTVEGDNCTDVYANDLGIVARRDRDGCLAGFDLLVGGGLGRTANKPKTYPAVAQPLGFVTPDQLVEASRAIISIQRDYGDRSDRRHARFKYLIAERGLTWFRRELQERISFELAEPRPLEWEPTQDHLGWHEQGDGRLFCGVYIENGRIADTEQAQLRTGLRRIVQRLRPGVRLTAQQNLILTDIEPADRSLVDQLLAEHGILPARQVHLAVRHSMACPAMPTCGLAVAESERVMPELIRRIAAIVDELGLGQQRISYRMTGCPNGCARPYLGDVGFVGTTLGKYDVFLGGDYDGTRLNRLYSSNVPIAEIPSLLRSPLAAFAEERDGCEGFGDWCHRVGVDGLRDRFLLEPVGGAS